MPGPIGLQQLLRMQGIEWGDAANGDKHLWFDGGSLNTNATWNTSSYGLQTAPSPWTNGGNGNPWGWAGTSSVIKAAETQSTAAVFNLLTFSGLTQAYAGSTAALENRTYSDTSSQNYTGKIRASFDQVIVQTSGGTMTRVEPATGIAIFQAGSSGTLTSGYGTAGELFHQSDTYLVTAFWSSFGTTQLQANGDCTTGYGGNFECLTDALGTGATGTFTTAHGTLGNVTHANLSTITNAYGHRGQVQNQGTGIISTGRAFYGVVSNTSSGTIPIATGIELLVSNTGTGAITTGTGVLITAPVATAAHPITTARGIRISNMGATGITTAVGLMIDIQTGASSQSISLVLGAAPGSGTYTIYATNTNPSFFTGDIYFAAGAQAMTAGFLYIPAATGAPSGVPAGHTGTVPMYYDTTNNFLYIYSGGWKKSTVYA